MGYDEVKNAVLSLEGFKREGSFDVITGETEATGNPGVMWTFANNAGNAAYNAPFVADATAGTVAYTLILFPQAFDAPLPFSAELTGAQTFSAVLDFTAANRNAGDTAPKNEWVAGRQYNLSVTLHKTSLTVDGCTIAPWNEANGGNVNAD